MAFSVEVTRIIPMKNKRIDWSRLKHYQALWLLIFSIISLVLGIIHFVEGFHSIHELASQENGNYYATIQLAWLILKLFVSFGVFGCGAFNALTGKLTKYVEIFHWVEIALLAADLFDNLYYVPSVGFIGAFNGEFGFAILIISIVAIIGFAIFAELNERLGKALAKEAAAVESKEE